MTGAYPPVPPAAPVPGAVPLAYPLYGASLPQAVSRFWRKYATFGGRASRSEFWWWYLVNVVVTIVLYLFTLFGALGGAYRDELGRSQPGPLIVVGGLLLVGWWLATVVPTLAVTWRRLHDTNKSGAFFFFGLIPFVGGILLIVFLVLEPDPAGARFDARQAGAPRV